MMQGRLKLCYVTPEQCLIIAMMIPHSLDFAFSCVASEALMVMTEVVVADYTSRCALLFLTRH